MRGDVKLTQKLSLWISLLVPGLITPLVDFDVGIFAAYTLISSLYGFKTVFLLLFVYLIVHLVNDISGRIVIVSGMGLVELIRERFGIRMSFVVFIVSFVFDFLAVLQCFLALRVIASLLRLNYLAVGIMILLYLLLIFLYKLQKFSNRIFVLIALFYSAILFLTVSRLPHIIFDIASSPLSPGDLVRGSVPLYFLALLGSTSSSWNQMLVSRYTYRTKLNLDRLKYHTLDSRVTTVMTYLFSVLFVAAAWFLFPGGSAASLPATALTRFIPVAHPDIRAYLFVFGFLSVIISTIYAVSLSLSHVFSEFFGQDRSEEEGGRFSLTHILIYLLIAVPALIAANTSSLTFLGSVLLFGFLQSFSIFAVVFFLLHFGNSVSVMGRYRIGALHNFFLWGSAAATGVLMVITLARWFLFP